MFTHHIHIFSTQNIDYIHIPITCPHIHTVHLYYIFPYISIKYTHTTYHTYTYHMHTVHTHTHTSFTTQPLSLSLSPYPQCSRGQTRTRSNWMSVRGVEVLLVTFTTSFALFKSLNNVQVSFWSTQRTLWWQLCSTSYAQDTLEVTVNPQCSGAGCRACTNTNVPTTIFTSAHLKPD